MLKPDYKARDCILIVDDDALQRELMYAALSDLDFDIYEAENGAEALDQFKAHAPVLVVMDIHMPVMDGYEACQQMRGIDGGEDAAIILITGAEDLASVERAYDVGALEFISKPFSWPVLQMRIKYILRIQQTYREVQARQKQLSWAQRAAEVGFWEVLPERQELRLSAESTNILGAAAAATRYSLQTVADHVAPPDRPKLLAAYRDLVHRNVPMNLDIRLDLDAEQSIFAHVRGEQVTDRRGRGTSINGTVQNISARKLAEERIREAAAMKDQFLANMSHEMRTPINGVMGMADLLKATALDPEQSTWVGHISDSARHLQAVLNDVLDFAKIRDGGLHLHSDSFELAPAVEAAVAAVSVLAAQKGLSLAVDLKGSLPEMVVGDAGRIRQVLLNLLGNAIKFTERGSISVELSCLRAEEQACEIRFAVEDTGIGIPLGKQDMVFEQFTQVDGSLTREREGTGLGLAIVRELVQLMNGKVGISSQEGVGTKIWFDLPLDMVAGSTVAGPVAGAPDVPDGFDATGVQVLLAEDNAVNRLYARKLLERSGFKVDVAGNGEEALSRVQSCAYDVVLMDCQMPVMDGYEATRRIRTLGGVYAQLPIIALTAHAMAGDREICLAAGMDDHVTKPVEGDTLMAKVYEWATACPVVQDQQV